MTDSTTPVLLPGIDDFLRKIGVSSMDSDFSELRRQVQRAIVLKEDYTGHAPERWEDEIIERLSDDGCHILDLGCGDGDLLVRMVHKKHARVQGVEANEDAVIHCVERGLPVYQGDIEEVLGLLPDNSFDMAILENTLQTLMHPLDTLNGMLHIARVCAISFPNFAHWSIRLAFSLSGKMPITSSLPYTWYDTPNIHLCSISDFLDWTTEQKVHIIDAYALVEGSIVPFEPNIHNITAEQVLFIVEKAR